MVNIVRWRIPKENSSKLFELWREMMDYQRSHSEKFYYTRSRFFTFTEEGSSEENWMFLDEYDNREAYDKTMKTMREDPEVAKLADEFFPKWDALIVPGSKKKGEIWTEVLRVELK
ncbi:MAG: hypothetical protein WB661_04815 [Candidatus Bathyarchaeia archaeon]